MTTEHVPPSAELSPGVLAHANIEAASNSRIPRGGRDVPTVDGERREFQRSLTFRLEPTKEQFALLRLRDAQAAQYMNRFSIHLYCDSQGYRAPEASAKPKLTSVDNLPPQDLSSSIYVACQKRVRNDWKRIGKRIWSGVQIPTYRKGSLPFDSGGRAEKGTCCGIKIVRTSDAGYAARLHITSSSAEGDNWIEVSLSRRTEIDQHRAQKAAEFADGKLDALGGQVSFERDMTLLRIGFKFTKIVTQMGDRVATLSEFEDGRLLLRGEFCAMDWSSRLHALKTKKIEWDGIRRRFSRRMSRRKGSARRHREKLDFHSFSKWAGTEMHAWSASMIDWAKTQGCGSVVIALTGSDWPAHDLAAKLKYKAEECGVKVLEPSLEQEPTELAVDAAVNKKKRRAKKLGEAMREISNQLGVKKDDDDKSRN